MKTPKLRGVLGDADIQALRNRNDARLRKMIAELGEIYVLHPANRVSRKAVNHSLK